MSEKRTLTEEEEAMIPCFRQKYIDSQTVTADMDDTCEIIDRVWHELENKSPNIELYDSPDDCRNHAISNFGKEGFSNLTEYWSIWLSEYAALYDFANEIGIPLDQPTLDTFLKWERCCPFILFDDDTVYVSRKLDQLHITEDERLHNESGPSAAFKDDWGIWNINGVQVNEQIVMSPETQTIEQIKEETNEERRRIRIERYGTENYIRGVNAKVIDGPHANYIEGTKEALFKTDTGEVYLYVVCPTTAEDYWLQMPQDIETCVGAQLWASCGFSGRTISAS